MHSRISLLSSYRLVQQKAKKYKKEDERHQFHVSQQRKLRKPKGKKNLKPNLNKQIIFPFSAKNKFNKDVAFSHSTSKRFPLQLPFFSALIIQISFST